MIRDGGRRYRRAADELDRYLELDSKTVGAEEIREIIKESRYKELTPLLQVLFTTLRLLREHLRR